MADAAVVAAAGALDLAFARCGREEPPLDLKGP
jgi:hypothetical protein